MNPKLHSSQHQWQDNLIKAQEYIYGERDTTGDIIVGSSLSCRLAMDSLPSFSTSRSAARAYLTD
ncbi:MAG TPA: hypothetical protein VKQ08_07135 [Cyclobacteriaceae bacterium]|nr:hypothetical protein [Cyclobacteriaceae bacterium]